MLVYVNGESWPVSETSLEGVLDEAVCWARSQGEVVTEIRIDGSEYSGDPVDLPPNGQVQEIRLTTSPVKQLMDETKISVRDYVPRLSAASRQAAWFFQAGREGEAASLCVSIIDGLDWMLQAVVRLAALDPEYISQDELAALHGNIKEILPAWDNGDYLLVADLLEYELAPLLDRWLAEKGR